MQKLLVILSCVFNLFLYLTLTSQSVFTCVQSELYENKQKGN